MSWDQPTFSFDQGQPPTPSKTPTSFSAGDSFQTPRLESSFYDPRVTWDTSNPSIGSPILLRTPRQLSFGATGSHIAASPTQANYSKFGIDFASNAEKLLSTPNFESLNADETQTIGSQVIFQSEQENNTASQVGLPLDTSDIRSAGSMQTPPPTSSSASKRRARQKQAAELFQQSKSATVRRMSVPLAPRQDNNGAPSSQVEDSPQQFASLDFSPDIFGYNFAAPTTAPLYPQHKLFWEPDDNQNDVFDFSNHVPNPFDTPRQSGMAPFPSEQSQSSSQAPVSSSFMDFSNEITPMQSFVQSSFVQPSSQNRENESSVRQLHSGVDPSLLFSSPGKLSEPLDGSIASSRVLTEESLQPYAHQVQEARRERSNGGISKSKKRRKPSVDSPAVQAALETLREDGSHRPPIRRSMTDSVVSAASRESGSSKPGSAHGRSSPSKRNREAMQKRRHRTSIALTIDENGRARTETRIIEDSEGSGSHDRMDLDSASQESCSETSDELPDAVVASFAQRVPQPKMGRFSSSQRAQVGPSHSQKSSYASFYSSTSHQDEQPSLPDLKRGSGWRSGAAASGPLNQVLSREEEAVSEAETLLDPEEDGFNAQSELRKVMRNRQSSQSSRPTHHVYSPYNNHTAHFPPNDFALANISPTTLTDPDLATPSSGQSSSPGIIRCICNISRDDGQMIQCESCRNWLHIPCAALNPQRLPQIYLCLFCTGSTPTVRGGRVRDPSRKGYLQPSSPLAQKAPRFR